MTPTELTDPSAVPQEKMGARFVRAGLLTQEQVNLVVDLQEREGLRFGEAAVQLGFISEQNVQAVLSEQFNYATALDTPEHLARGLAIAHAPFSPEAEAVRQIRAGLSIHLAGRAHAAVAVVSPAEGEGKSYVAASLAIAFSQTGRRTLLLNANLRASGQHDLFGLGSDGDGLSSMLAGRAPPAAGHPVQGFPHLSVLDAGPQPPNPLEILLEPALRRLIDTFHAHADLIIVDTPAAIASSDAQVIARQTDTCLLVARQHLTSMGELQRTHDMLRAAGAQVAGTVYNAFEGAARAPRRRRRAAT